jgi:ribonuclease HII
MVPRPARALLFPGLGSHEQPTLLLEQRYLDMGFAPVAGLDEAGRGPLAGPVVAAACVLPAKVGLESRLWRVRDSKTLSPREREELFEVISEEAEDAAWSLCDHEEIDRSNILSASLKAMTQAVGRLKRRPALCQVDGNHALPSRTPSVPGGKGASLPGGGAPTTG